MLKKLFSFSAKASKIIYNKVLEIRRSDIETKRRWFIGTSIVSMVLVVGMWIVYIDYTSIPEETSQADTVEERSTAETFQKGFGRFFSKIDAGLSASLSKGIDVYEGFTNIFEKKREYEITPNSN